MPQKKKIKITTTENSHEVQLASLLADIHDSKKMLAFLHDFLSKTELQQLSTRLAIYLELKDGKSYEQIQKQLGVSSATISTASAQQKQPSLQSALKILEIDVWARKTAEKLQKYMPFL